MRAIILAAGRGQRLKQAEGEQMPKCLLSFDGMSLLERHLRMLKNAGVEEVVLAVGFRYEQIVKELERIDWQPKPTLVINPDFELGSVLTLHTARAAMLAGDDVIVMDADVLYDERIMRPLTRGSSPVNRLLIDRGFEPGDEPMKVCVKDGVPIELRKQLESSLQYDTIGESVGFFRFDAKAAKRVADIVAGYVDSGRSHMLHEEALRDFIRERSARIEAVDVTGAPWIEIDFPVDVERATFKILPKLEQIAGVST